MKGPKKEFDTTSSIASYW